jgi:hypothetical protein
MPTEVKIITPAGGTEIAPESTFYVNAVVSNPDRELGIPDATATLAIEGNAELVAGEEATKLIDLPACGVADVWWKVECTDPGPVVLTVTSGAGSDEVKIKQTGEQPQDADVLITWVETPCMSPFNGTVPVGTYFTVKALATYVPSGYAENASMTIHWDGDLELLSPATVKTGDLYKVRPEEAMWNFKCLGKGDASVWVEFNSVDVDPAKVLYPPDCEFYQGDKPDEPEDPGYWELELYAPEKVCTNCAQNTFTVTARAQNHTSTADDVYATLVIDNALLAAFETGTLVKKPGESVAKEGGYSSWWEWNLICLSAGPTSLTVELRHTATGPVFLTETITVQQKDYLVLLGDANDLVGDPAVINPDTQVYRDLAFDPAEFVNWHPATLKAETERCDIFTVKTTFENCTCAPFGVPGVSHVIAQVNLPSTVDLTGMITIEEWVRVADEEGHPYADSQLKNSYQIPAQAVIDNGYILPLQTQCACCYFVITWKLECIGGDEDYQEVSFHAHLSTDTTTLLDETHFDLLQSNAPHIQTGIEYFQGWYDSTLGTKPIEVIAAPCGTEGTSLANEFTAVIAVSNTGDVTADALSLTATMTGNYADAQRAIMYEGGTLSAWLPFVSPQLFTLGSLDGHEALKILIRAHCSGPEDVVIHLVEVNAIDHLTTLKIWGTNDGDPTNDSRDACDNRHVCFAPDKTLIQIPLSITIVEPTEGQHFYVSSDYAVKIIVQNCSQIQSEVLHGLEASLSWLGQVEFNNDTATHPLGDLGPGMFAETAWQVHCTGAGGFNAGALADQSQEVNGSGAFVLFKVTLTGSEPVLEMTRTVSVYQDPTSHIEITISSPRVNPSQWLEYATGQKFALTAWVFNSGPLPAENVWIFVGSSLDLLYVPAFQVVDDPNTAPQSVNIGTLEAMEGKFVTWTMQAVRPTRPFEGNFPGPVGGFQAGSGIALLGMADNSNVELETMFAYSYPAAKLIVTLDPIPDVPVDTDFIVSGTITNIGGADATDVTLNLASLYGNVAPAVGSSFTQYIGTLPGAHEGLQSAVPVSFSFNVQCEGLGKTSIRVTPEGKDEYGFSAVFAAWQVNGDGLPEELWHVGPFWRNWFDVGVPLSPIPDFCIIAADTTFKQIDITAPLVAIYTPNGVTQASKTYTIGYGSAAPDVAKYEVKLNDGLWMDNQLNTTFTFTGLVDGVNTLYVRATDLSGNVGPEVSITVIVDMTIPTVTIDPIEGLTSQSAGTISYGAAGGTAPYTYRVRLGMGAWTDMSNATSFMYSGLVEGMNVLSVEAKDALGKTGMAFTYVTLDTTAPTGTVVINGGAAKTNDTEATLAVEAYDLHGPLEYSTDGSAWSFVAPTAADLSMGDGVKTVKVWFKDVVGNIGSAIGTIVLDTTAPDVAISSDSVTQESTTFTIAYGSAAADVVKYQVKLNAGSWMDNQLNTSYTFYALPVGANTLYVRAVDDAGNVGAWDQIVVTVVDLTAPVAPFANPIGGFYTAPQTVVLNDAEAGVTIYYTLNGTLPTMSSTVYAAPINIGAGTTVLKAIAVDASHNVSDVFTAIYVVNPVTVVSTTLNMINGYQLISLPFSASINVLGTNVTEVYEWTGVLWNAVTTLNPGIGYLVKHTGVETVTASGTATSSPYMISSIGSYQLIGNPFEVAIPWTSVTGSAIAEAYSWNGALWVSATGSMQPGIGYLVRTTSVGSLAFVRP